VETETDQNPTSINIFIVLVELYFNLAIFIYGENIDVLRDVTIWVRYSCNDYDLLYGMCIVEDE